MKTIQHFVGGKNFSGNSKRTGKVFNPATGEQSAEVKLANSEDIDKAVVLGLNYPSGPLSFGETLGPKNILKILEGLYSSYGDPRYRPSPWLRRRAMLGLSLFDKEI